MKIFSERLRITRVGKKMTQAQMANRLSITQQSYNRYETNKGEPHLQMLIDICNVLDEDIEYLLGLRD